MIEASTLGLLLLGLHSLLPLPDEFQIVILDGQSRSVAQLTVKNQVVVGTTKEGKSIELNLKQVEKIHHGKTNGEKTNREEITRNVSSGGKVARLSDGSVVRFENFKQIGNGQLELTGPDSFALILKRTAVRSIQIDQGIDREKWRAQVDESKVATDALVIRTDGELDLLDGIIRGIEGENVEFEFEGVVRNVKLSRLAGIRFFVKPVKKRPQLGVVADRWGNRFNFSQLNTVGSNLEIELQSGILISRPINEFLTIDFSAGRYVYLDRLKPQSVTWNPFLEGAVDDPKLRDLVRDNLGGRFSLCSGSVFGLPLLIDQRDLGTKENPLGRTLFEKGIAVRGGTEVVYQVPNGASRFEATAGIDRRATEAGEVQFELRVDGKSVKSHYLTGKDGRATKINIPIDGERLTLRITYGKYSEVGDILVLGNARFRK